MLALIQAVMGAVSGAVVVIAFSWVSGIEAPLLSYLIAGSFGAFYMLFFAGIGR